MGSIINKREAGNVIQSAALAVALTADRVGDRSPELMAWLDGYAAACGVIALGLGIPDFIQRLNGSAETVLRKDGFPETNQQLDGFPDAPGVRILTKGYGREF
jgi:hypothetical protein